MRRILKIDDFAAPVIARPTDFGKSRAKLDLQNGSTRLFRPGQADAVWADYFWVYENGGHPLQPRMWGFGDSQDRPTERLRT